MKLRSHECLLTIASSLLLVSTGTANAYETYYIEQRCQTGNLTIPLVDGGEGSAVFLKSTTYTSYSKAMDCRIHVMAPPVHRIMVSVLEIGFRMNPTPGLCKDYIQINRIICEDVFRLDEERHYLSSDNTMQMLYHVSKEGLNNYTLSGYPGIKLTLTALKEGRNCRSPDETNWFKCDNGYCIWSGLKCDSHNNCGDLSDEQDCGNGGGSSTVLIILGGLILLLMVIMCVATLLCSKNETVRRFSSRLRSRTLSYIPKFSK